MSNLEEFGGDNIDVLDSNKVWEEDEFGDKFPEDFTEGDHPPRILLFTTTSILQQLACSEKWSQVRFHFNFIKQIFIYVSFRPIIMLKCFFTYITLLI